MLKLIHAYDMDFSNVQEYYAAFKDKSRDLNSYAIWTVFQGEEKYFEYIKTYEKNMYYLVNEDEPNYIIGYGTIEDKGILNYHKEYMNVGNIGYGVRPNERNKGYGTYLLKLLLLECKKLGMHEVCISCLKENAASKHVILNNNGKLEKEFYDDNSGKHGLKYWVVLHPSIPKMIRRYVRQEKYRYMKK